MHMGAKSTFMAIVTATANKKKKIKPYFCNRNMRAQSVLCKLTYTVSTVGEFSNKYQAKT